MKYKVTILGKSYDLPPRTLAVDDQIEAMHQTDAQFQGGEITRREAVTRMHDFVERFSPGALPAVEEVDTNDLVKAATDIISAYDEPARKARSDAKLAEARELLAKPEIAKLMALYGAKK